MEAKKTRELKVYEMSGRNYKPTATIMLKRQRLEELGFKAGEKMNIRCEGGKITITINKYK